jgi:uncharacterized protein YbaP (TraB family)
LTVSILTRLRSLLLQGIALCLLLPALAAADTAPAGTRLGLLYEVTDGPARLYLFGTVHAGKPEYYPFNATVMAALKGSRYLALEADVSNQSAMVQEMTQHATYTGGDALERHVSPSVMQKLKPVLDQYGLPVEMISTLKPWMAASLLDMFVIQEAGYSPEFGADMMLAAAAKQMDKPIVEVESMKMQIQLFESFTASEQELFLSNTIDEITNGQGSVKLSETIDAWAKGDAQALNKVFVDSVAELPPEAKFIDKKLIKDRNASMTQRIDGFLHSGSVYFVAVGAGHVVGSDGIVERFKAKGYKVRDMQQ